MAARLFWSESLSNNRFLLSCANVKFYLEINRKRLGKSGHREHPAPSSHGRDALLSSLIKGRKHDGFGLQDAAGNHSGLYRFFYDGGFRLHSQSADIE